MSRAARFLSFLAFSGVMLSVAPFPAAAQTHSYFDMTEAFSSDNSAFTKWTGMVARFVKQQKTPEDQCDHVPFYPCKLKDWHHFLQQQQGKPEHDQLNAINNYANSFPYITDWVNWGVEDYWETPYEFLAVSGNCKDYAIAKYYSLRAIGVPASRLRIIVLQDLNLGGVIHAVLGVYDDNQFIILDNQIKQVIAAKSIYHYRPIYGINEQGWWRYRPR
ncbi:MAG: transglutaminase-like cysteine peptidase [Alphaproteobacteria bacterium]|nr:transglutaminase-like cysteine peptidase [Alphaproteobacteria bacterium]